MMHSISKVGDEEITNSQVRNLSVEDRALWRMLQDMRRLVSKRMSMQLRSGESLGLINLCIYSNHLDEFKKAMECVAKIPPKFTNAVTSINNKIREVRSWIKKNKVPNEQRNELVDSLDLLSEMVVIGRNKSTTSQSKTCDMEDCCQAFLNNFFSFMQTPCLSNQKESIETQLSLISLKMSLNKNLEHSLGLLINKIIELNKKINKFEAYIGTSRSMASKGKVSRGVIELLREALSGYIGSIWESLKHQNTSATLNLTALTDKFIETCQAIVTNQNTQDILKTPWDKWLTKVKSIFYAPTTTSCRHLYRIATAVESLATKENANKLQCLQVL